MAETFLSPEMLGTLMDDMNTSGKDMVAKQEAILAPLKELNNQAAASASMYRTNIGELMTQAEGVNNDLVESLTMPPKIGRLLSLFGNDKYNSQKLAAKAGAITTKMSNESRRYEATQNLIKTQADNLKVELSAQESLTNFKMQNVSNILTGFNASRQAQVAMREQNVFDLTGMKDEQLNGMAELAAKAGSVVVKGRKFSQGDIAEAQQKKMERYQATMTWQAAMKKSMLDNTKASYDLLRAETTNLFKTKSFGELRDLVASGQPHVVRGPDGVVLGQITTDEVAAQAMARLQDDKDGNQFMNKLFTGVEELTTDLTNVVDLVNSTVSMPGFDPAAKREIMAKSRMLMNYSTLADSGKKKLDDITHAFSSSGDVNALAASERLMTPSEFALVSGGFNKEIKDETAALRSLVDTKWKDFLGSQPPVAKQAWEEMRTHGMKMATFETAGRVLATEIANPTNFAFDGSRASLNEPMQSVTSKLYPEGAAAMLNEDGTFKADFNVASMLETIGGKLADDPKFVYLKLDDKFSKYRGFKGAVIGNDLTEIYRQSLHAYSQKHKLPGLEQIVDSAGNWTAASRPLLNQLGPRAFITSVLGQLDAKNIATNQYSTNESTLTRFYAHTLESFQAGDIGLKNPNTQTNAAADFIVYQNNPGRVLSQIVASDMHDAPEKLNQQLQQYQAHLTGSMDGVLMPKTGEVMHSLGGRGQIGPLNNMTPEQNTQRQTLQGTINPPTKAQPTGNPALDRFWGYK